jgi:hypothetical protein
VTKLRIVRWTRYVACIREVRNAYLALVEKLEVNRHLWRRRRGWEDNIKIDLKIVSENVDRTLLAQDRVQWQSLVKTVKNFRAS